MLYRICLLLVLVVGASHGLVKLHRAVDPVDDGDKYIIAAKHNVHFDELEEKLSDLTSDNETLKYTVIWNIPIGAKFLFVQMNEATLNVVRQLEDDIVYIEQDGWLTIQSKETSGNETKDGKDKPKKTTGQPTEQWGLDRIDQRNLPLDGVFSVKPNAGTGAHIYIIGTGIHVKHEEFGGRASNIYDYRGEDENGRDCNGHGTHLASLAAGKTYGVAKNATIYGLRITRCRGSAKLSDAIKAMEWLSHNAEWPGVAVVGVGSTGESPSLDNAIHQIYLKGCMVVLPAGNNNSLACDTSPARMSNPITVAATTKPDYAVFYSNHGSCVDIFAPGLGVEGAFYDGTTNTFVETASGTSMASAYVAGAVAMHMGNGMPPFKIKAYLLRHATEGQIHQAKDDTPNKLLYVGKVRTIDDYKRIVGPKTSKKDSEEKDSEKEEEKKKNEDEKKGDKTADQSSKDKTKTEL